MKIYLEQSKCQAYGNCADEAPSLFRLDDNGFAVLLVDEIVPDGEEANARNAVLSCPAQAIRSAE